eukprot:TRINITY_DN1689_c0_g1_i1.p1 TRINITY_DN1689_c0_g1~~TRINITY_DN1689_c0_g1_i1.p1  ORF type:complete len:295 (-),score=37.95 TRINITY_DN1689_c0_g1_i1:48-893(-)
MSIPYILYDFAKISAFSALLVYLFNFFWHPLLCDHHIFSDKTLFVIGTCLIHGVLYFGVNSLFYYWEKNGILKDYRVNRKENLEVPTKELISKTIISALISQLTLQPLVLYFTYEYSFSKMGSTVCGVLPDPITVFIQVYISILVNDFGFYTTHRLLHYSFLYKMIHKKHHSYKQTIGFAAEYSHFIESLLSNQIPTVLGPILLGSHISTFWVYLFWRLMKTYRAHSGFTNLPFFLADSSTEFHDFHHTHNSGNFGVSPLFDTLLNTNTTYIKFLNESKQK